ncbi:MAG: penicillin-binding transpeptidase domain-containing protein [Turicibacter sp.]|nr:penicillin-binding transpeptidase domain-containing protein [Turicibacter sp.]
MRDLLEDVGRAVGSFLTNRIVWLIVLTFVLFGVLVSWLFELQIVRSYTFTRAAPVTTTTELAIPAHRGNIYDRYGRPLTTNVTTHVITMDSSIPISNEGMLELTRLFERNGENFVNDFPMTTTWPYEFTLGGGTPEIMQARIFRWNDDMTVPDPHNATATEAFLHLREQFNIDPALSNADARRILNFTAMNYVRRFRSEIFEIATDVSLQTIAAIEERNDLFANVSVELRTLREYPAGQYISHILGYTGRVTAEDLAVFPGEGYSDDDMIGKTGLERSMERHLRGVEGTQTIEINPSTGRRVFGEFTPVIVPATPGDNIFLTLDIEMQGRTFDILVDHLTELNIRQIESPAARITHQRMFNNIVRGGWLPIREVMEASEDMPSVYALQNYILAEFPDATPLREDRNHIVDIITTGINNNSIPPYLILTSMVELGILTDTDDFSERARVGREPVNSLIVEKMRMGEITPQMINLDPSTGSVVVLDVNTGAVLAAVGYPNFDNNMLANSIDPEYYARVNGFDPTHPLINRPFMEGRAPGSTFKMITAVAGLESGTITPSTLITDRVAFTRAGTPAAHCWHRTGHGSINVIRAIAASCNYFFFETAFRLGNSSSSRIDVLNRYMEFFGLNERTGVEVGELADSFNRATLPNIMSSPDRKRWRVLNENEFAPQGVWGWFDGDTIRTAIGQSENSYSAATMARYILQIANRGDRLPLHLVNSVLSSTGEVVMQTIPTPDYTGINVSESTWDAIHRGMLDTTEGGGTGVAHFRGFPFQVGGKTGTAQELDGRADHTAFGGFAPFDNPQIAVYVAVPFGANPLMPALAAQISREVIREFLTPTTTTERPLAINALMR